MPKGKDSIIKSVGGVVGKYSKEFAKGYFSSEMPALKDATVSTISLVRDFRQGAIKARTSFKQFFSFNNRAFDLNSDQIEESGSSGSAESFNEYFDKMTGSADTGESGLSSSVSSLSEATGGAINENATKNARYLGDMLNSNHNQSAFYSLKYHTEQMNALQNVQTLTKALLEFQTEKAAQYYSDSLAYQRTIAESVEGIKESLNNFIESRKGMEDDVNTGFISGGKFSTGAYLDHVWKNVKNSEIGMAFQMGKQMLTDPGSVLSMLFSSNNKKTKLGKIDDIFSRLAIHTVNALSTNLYNSKNPFAQLFSNIFGVRNDKSDKINLNDYLNQEIDLAMENKKAKAITEVIPRYLSELTAAITGKEMIFDYSTGRFKSIREAVREARAIELDSVIGTTSATAGILEQNIESFMKNANFSDSEMDAMINENLKILMSFCVTHIADKDCFLFSPSLNYNYLLNEGMTPFVGDNNGEYAFKMIKGILARVAKANPKLPEQYKIQAREAQLMMRWNKGSGGKELHERGLSHLLSDEHDGYVIDRLNYALNLDKDRALRSVTINNREQFEATGEFDETRGRYGEVVDEDASLAKEIKNEVLNFFKKVLKFDGNETIGKIKDNKYIKKAKSIYRDISDSLDIGLDTLDEMIYSSNDPQILFNKLISLPEKTLEIMKKSFKESKGDQYDENHFILKAIEKAIEWKKSASPYIKKELSKISNLAKSLGINEANSIIDTTSNSDENGSGRGRYGRRKGNVRQRKKNEKNALEKELEKAKETEKEKEAEESNDLDKAIDNWEPVNTSLAHVDYTKTGIFRHFLSKHKNLAEAVNAIGNDEYVRKYIDKGNAKLGSLKDKIKSTGIYQKTANFFNNTAVGQFTKNIGGAIWSAMRDKVSSMSDIAKGIIEKMNPEQKPMGELITAGFSVIQNETKSASEKISGEVKKINDNMLGDDGTESKDVKPGKKKEGFLSKFLPKSVDGHGGYRRAAMAGFLLTGNPLGAIGGLAFQGIKNARTRSKLYNKHEEWEDLGYIEPNADNYYVVTELGKKVSKQYGIEELSVEHIDKEGRLLDARGKPIKVRSQFRRKAGRVLGKIGKYAGSAIASTLLTGNPFIGLELAGLSDVLKSKHRKYEKLYKEGYLAISEPSEDSKDKNSYYIAVMDDINHIRSVLGKDCIKFEVDENSKTMIPYIIDEHGKKVKPRSEFRKKIGSKLKKIGKYLAASTVSTLITGNPLMGLASVFMHNKFQKNSFKKKCDKLEKEGYIFAEEDTRYYRVSANVDNNKSLEDNVNYVKSVLGKDNVYKVDKDKYIILNNGKPVKKKKEDGKFKTALKKIGSSIHRGFDKAKPVLKKAAKYGGLGLASVLATGNPLIGLGTAAATDIIGLLRHRKNGRGRDDDFEESESFLPIQTSSSLNRSVPEKSSKFKSWMKKLLKAGNSKGTEDADKVEEALINSNDIDDRQKISILQGYGATKNTANEIEKAAEKKESFFSKLLGWIGGIGGSLLPTLLKIIAPVAGIGGLIAYFTNGDFQNFVNGALGWLGNAIGGLWNGIKTVGGSLLTSLGMGNSSAKYTGNTAYQYDNTEADSLQRKNEYAIDKAGQLVVTNAASKGAGILGSVAGSAAGSIAGTVSGIKTGISAWNAGLSASSSLGAGLSAKASTQAAVKAGTKTVTKGLIKSAGIAVNAGSNMIEYAKRGSLYGKKGDSSMALQSYGKVAAIGANAISRIARKATGKNILGVTTKAASDGGALTNILSKVFQKVSGMLKSKFPKVAEKLTGMASKIGQKVAKSAVGSAAKNILGGLSKAVPFVSIALYATHFANVVLDAANVRRILEIGPNAEVTVGMRFAAAIVNLIDDIAFGLLDLIGIKDEIVIFIIGLFSKDEADRIEKERGNMQADYAKFLKENDLTEEEMDFATYSTKANENFWDRINPFDSTLDDYKKNGKMWKKLKNNKELQEKVRKRKEEERKNGTAEDQLKTSSDMSETNESVNVNGKMYTDSDADYENYLRTNNLTEYDVSRDKYSSLVNQSPLQNATGGEKLSDYALGGRYNTSKTDVHNQIASDNSTTINITVNGGNVDFGKTEFEPYTESNYYTDDGRGRGIFGRMRFGRVRSNMSKRESANVLGSLSNMFKNISLNKAKVNTYANEQRNNDTSKNKSYTARKMEAFLSKKKGRGRFGRGMEYQDGQYANIPFGRYDNKTDTVGDGGCALFAAKNAMSKLGINSNIPSLANDALSGGYKRDNDGVSPDFIVDEGRKHGVSFTPGSASDTVNALAKGQPVVLMGSDGRSREGLFGPGKHYVTAVGLDPMTNEMIIQDSDSRTNTRQPISSLRNADVALIGGRGRFGRGIVSGYAKNHNASTRSLLDKFWSKADQKSGKISIATTNSIISEHGIDETVSSGWCMKFLRIFLMMAGWSKSTLTSNWFSNSPVESAKLGMIHNQGIPSKPYALVYMQEWNPSNSDGFKFGHIALYIGDFHGYNIIHLYDTTRFDTLERIASVSDHNKRYKILGYSMVELSSLGLPLNASNAVHNEIDVGTQTTTTTGSNTSTFSGESDGESTYDKLSAFINGLAAPANGESTYDKLSAFINGLSGKSTASNKSSSGTSGNVTPVRSSYNTSNTYSNASNTSSNITIASGAWKTGLNDEQIKNAAELYSTLESLEYGKAQIAAIMGNAWQESRFKYNISAMDTNGLPSSGLFMFNYPPLVRGYQEFLSKTGRSDSPSSQAMYMDEWIRSDSGFKRSGYTANEFKNGNFDVNAATEIFMKGFENPNLSLAHLDNRKAMANKIYDTWGRSRYGRGFTSNHGLSADRLKRYENAANRARRNSYGRGVSDSTVTNAIKNISSSIANGQPSGTDLTAVIKLLSIIATTLQDISVTNREMNDKESASTGNSLVSIPGQVQLPTGNKNKMNVLNSIISM